MRSDSQRKQVARKDSNAVFVLYLPRRLLPSMNLQSSNSRYTARGSRLFYSPMEMRDENYQIFSLPALCLFFIATDLSAQNGKVDFSGVWYLQKDRSDPSDIGGRTASLKLAVIQEQDDIAIDRMYNSFTVYEKLPPRWYGKPVRIQKLPAPIPEPTGPQTDKASSSQPKPPFVAEAMNSKSLRAKRGVCKKTGKY